MEEEIIINDDGTITRKKKTSSSNNNGSSSDNSGCIWAIIIAVCFIVGIIIAVNNSNNSTYPDSEEILSDIENEDVAEAVTYEEEKKETSYLNASSSIVTFEADGGSIDIEIDTDGEWEIGTQPENWGHITKYSSSITLRVDSYSGKDDRTDWFTIKAGEYEKRIEIIQHANIEPSATIERVSVDHNEFVNGYKGMIIHIELTTENILNQTIYVYAYFFQSDNQTPLHNQYGDALYFYGTGSPNYESCRFEDFKIFVPYVGLNMAPGVSGDFSFDISVKYGGEELDRNNNNQFSFTNGY